MQELRAGPHQILGTCPGQFGIGDYHHGVDRQGLDKELHPVAEHRAQRLHALHVLPIGDAFAHLGQVGVLGPHGESAFSHGVGDEDLSARVCGDPLDGFIPRALIGDGERTDLLDRVAEEIDAHRVIGRRREHIKNPSTYGELAPTLHEVDAVVGRRGEGFDQLVEIVFLTGCQGHRLQVTEPRGLGLDHSADRRHHDAGRRSCVLAGNSAEHFETPTDCVRARAQAFVRQRLPRGIVGHIVLTQDGRERRGHLLGFAVGRGDQQNRADLRERGRHERLQRLRQHDVSGCGVFQPCRRACIGYHGVGRDEFHQSRQAHRATLVHDPEPPFQCP